MGLKTEEHLVRLMQAFTFVVRNETFAVNGAAVRMQAELDRGFEHCDHTTIWEAIYGILSHSANLSKVFWPPSSKAEIVTRGQAMRTLFDVTDESPLFDRAVRNGFEHLDERLHTWLADVDPPTIIDQWIGDSASFEQYKERFILRTVIVDRGIVTVGPDSVKLFPLLRENDRIYVRWREIEGKGPHPEQLSYTRPN